MTQLNNNPIQMPDPEPPKEGPDRFAKAVGRYALALAEISGWTVLIVACLAAVLVAVASILWAFTRAIAALGIWSE